MKSEFEQIPGVGKKIASYISELGFHNLNDLRKANAEKMFAEFCALRGEQIDRCLLYVFRSVVEFARKPHERNWWEFKERSDAVRRSSALARTKADKDR